MRGEIDDRMERYLDQGMSRWQAEREALLDVFGPLPKKVRWIDSRSPDYDDAAAEEADSHD